MSVTEIDLAPARGQSMPAVQEAEASAQTDQFITFKVGAEEYGVDIMEVREIKGWTQATRLPNAPTYVRGVINLRGTMVPIFDLRARFGGGETEVTKTHVVVIVRVKERVIGILVDAVSDILSIDRSTVQPVPEMDGAEDAKFLCGLVSIEDRMVALLTLDRMFSLDRVDQKSLSAAELQN